MAPLEHTCRGGAPVPISPGVRSRRGRNETERRGTCAWLTEIDRATAVSTSVSAGAFGLPVRDGNAVGGASPPEVSGKATAKLISPDGITASGDEQPQACDEPYRRAHGERCHSGNRAAQATSPGFAD